LQRPRMQNLTKVLLLLPLLLLLLLLLDFRLN
jgi:hypothetical protein